MVLGPIDNSRHYTRRWLDFEGAKKAVHGAATVPTNCAVRCRLSIYHKRLRSRSRWDQEPWLSKSLVPESGQNPKNHYFHCSFNDSFGDFGKFEVPRPRRIDPDRSWPISSKFDLFYNGLYVFKKKKRCHFFLVSSYTHSSSLPGRLRPL